MQINTASAGLSSVLARKVLSGHQANAVPFAQPNLSLLNKSNIRSELLNDGFIKDVEGVEGNRGGSGSGRHSRVAESSDKSRTLPVVASVNRSLVTTNKVGMATYPSTPFSRLVNPGSEQTQYSHLALSRNAIEAYETTSRLDESYQLNQVFGFSAIA